MAGLASVLGGRTGRKINQFNEDEEIVKSHDFERLDPDIYIISKRWLEMVKLPMLNPKMIEKAKIRIGSRVSRFQNNGQFSNLGHVVRYLVQ